jgi:hypothetical protein
MVKISRRLRLCTFLACVLMSASSAFAQGGSPTFQPRYVPDISPTPRHRPEPKAPTPRVLILGGAAVAFLTAGALLYFAIKEWRAANIFERKYRFPRVRSAALRFGGNRSGGAMAAIEPANPKKET